MRRLIDSIDQMLTSFVHNLTSYYCLKVVTLWPLSNQQFGGKFELPFETCFVKFDITWNLYLRQTGDGENIWLMIYTLKTAEKPKQLWSLMSYSKMQLMELSTQLHTHVLFYTQYIHVTSPIDFFYWFFYFYFLIHSLFVHSTVIHHSRITWYILQHITVHYLNNDHDVSYMYYNNPFNN